MPGHLLTMPGAPEHVGSSSRRGAGTCAESRAVGSGAGSRWHSPNKGLEGTVRGKTDL